MPAEIHVGGHLEWRHRHDALQVEPGLGGHQTRDLCDVLGKGAAPTGLAVEAHLDEHVEVACVGAGAPRQGSHQLGPVDRLDDVGVGGDVACLVALDLTDEVEGEVWRTHGAKVMAKSRDLGPRLLVLVLADVAHAELVERKDVLGREELGDDDEGDLAWIAAGVAARAFDPVAHSLQPGSDLVAPLLRRLDHHAPAPRMTTTPAKRPVTRSRR
jgi:hypothetical protein